MNTADSSLGEADGKFGDTHHQDQPNIGPGPSAENPGGVYPKSSPRSAPSPVPQVRPVVGGSGSAPRRSSSPYAFDQAIEKLEVALDDAIRTIRKTEERGRSSGLEAKMLSWRRELEEIQQAKMSAKLTTQEGPLFTD